MKKNIYTIIVAALLAGPMAAHAVPVHFDVTYAATTGPNGVGSFDFDNAIGAITSFVWDFGGVTGGIADGQYGAFDVFGDTRGRFVFEMLSQTDAHAGADCLHGGCSTGDPITVGAGPLGAFSFSISSSFLAPAQYSFFGGSSSTGTLLLATPAAVPAPDTVSLFGIALCMFGIAIRRRIRQ